MVTRAAKAGLEPRPCSPALGPAGEQELCNTLGGKTSKHHQRPPHWTHPDHPHCRADHKTIKSPSHLILLKSKNPTSPGKGAFITPRSSPPASGSTAFKTTLLASTLLSGGSSSEWEKEEQEETERRGNSKFLFGLAGLLFDTSHFLIKLLPGSGCCRTSSSPPLLFTTSGKDNMCAFVWSWSPLFGLAN